MLGTFFIVYLNHKKDIAMFKLDVRMERLNKLYVPFYRMYCTRMLSFKNLTDLSYEDIASIFDILNENIHYLEASTQYDYYNVYKIYVDWIQCIKTNSLNLYLCESQLNSSFKALTDFILLDYRNILKKCHLPEPLPLPTNRRHRQK